VAAGTWLPASRRGTSGYQASGGCRADWPHEPVSRPLGWTCRRA